jgi:hypothetical protein
VLDAYSKMLGDAEQLGIEEINLSKLLDLMGYKAEVRTVPLGTAGGTPAATTPGQSGVTESAADEFRERQPPAAEPSPFP